MIECFFEDGVQAQGGGLRHAVTDVLAFDQTGSKILLVKRSPDAFTAPNAWALPGGYIDRDEKVVQAAEREFLEETGHTIKNKPLFLGFVDGPRQGEDRQNISFIWLVEVGDKIQEHDQEESEVKWWSLDDLPSKMAFDHLEIISRFKPQVEKYFR